MTRKEYIRANLIQIVDRAHDKEDMIEQIVDWVADEIQSERDGLPTDEIR